MYNFYKIDGSSHWTGIKEEEVIKDFLVKSYNENINVLGLDNFKGISFLLKGKTQNKADIVAIIHRKENSISVKKHSKAGTLDFINTSKMDVVFGSEKYKEIKLKLKDIKHVYQKNNDKVAAQEELDNFIDNLFKELEKNNSLINLFIKIRSELCDFLIISDKTKNIVTVIKKENLFLEKIFKSGNFNVSIINKNKKYSKKIFINGKDVHLRIRIVLNNGIRALLGINPKSKNCVLTMKIQIDKVDYLISESDHDTFKLFN